MFDLRARAALTCLLVVMFGSSGGAPAVQAESSPGPCDMPLNPIACENAQAGNPSSEWDIVGAGDPSIEGFATDISVNQGDTVHFKVRSDATAYRIDLYRLGYYGGLGARQVATVLPAVALPQTQPPCATDGSTGLVDCGTWSESASWAVPVNAVSGVYLARLTRTDPRGGASHVVFIVRSDGGASDILFQTSDMTWQAYNQYGGNSLYVGGPGINPGRAYKVSYNRPFTTRATGPEDWLFNAEYPMIRWLEANGYNVSYASGLDTERRGASLSTHRIFAAVGHDEYWSGGQRAAVESARAAGVHLAFFTGNGMYWKTRWEPSIAGPATPYRTLVSYKETHENAKIDPDPAWTGTWRDPRFSPPADGGRPENAVSGTIFTVNDPATTAITIDAAEGGHRFWRNTRVAALLAGQTATLADGTLGYEWDEDLDNGARPAGLVHLSSTTVNVPSKLLDYGSTYGPGTATHHLTLYASSSGSLVFGAGTVQWPWGLDAMHDRAPSTPDTAVRQATVNLLADMGSQPRTLQPGLAPAFASSDTAAPLSAIATPGNGASITNGAAATISGTAADTGGRVAGVEVSVDGGATWHLAAGTTAWSYQWVPDTAGPATIRSRAVDDSGNLETPSTGIRVTVVTPATATCPCSIWDVAARPSRIENDPNAIEVGVQFRSAVDGFITGLRFYKGSNNTGPHVGHLWEANGALLGSLTFTNETASGWQLMALDQPVPIAANTTYVASYHTTVGHYGADNYYFGAPVLRWPLQALADGADGSNGVYVYGASGFPTSAYNASNYWVDVTFVQTPPPDTVAPTILTISPTAGGPGVAAASTVRATFSEPMDPANISAATVELRDSGGTLIPSVVTYAATTRMATLAPVSPLAYSAVYTATVKGGSGPLAVRDLAGNAMAASRVWSFTTAAPPPPPPDQGPGGPVLVLASPGNPFGRYYAEILRAEGLNAFAVADVTTVSPALLAPYDVVILGEGALTAAQVATITDWVTAGGSLMAMRPDLQLSSLLGLAGGTSSAPNAYLAIDTSAPAGAGLVSQTVQYHGPADLYTLNGATALATLYSSATTARANPAVTMRAVGASGGQAVAFTYDLARSVVYTRQGNPAWSGQERDAMPPVRPDDLFFGGAPFDPQPDWVDLDKIAIPQADEQQRLLANLIVQSTMRRRPLPRFSYFPRGIPAVVVMTGDDHAGGGTAGRFNTFAADSPAGCSVDDWQCVRGTSYVYASTPLNEAQAAAFTAQGFEVALHVTTDCLDWTPASLDAAYTSQLSAWIDAYPSLPAPRTNRTHCIAWSDYATQPAIELAAGIRLDTNYYFWPSSWVQNRPGMFTGSGLPMRFASASGAMLDIYQTTTVVTDESGQTLPTTIDTLLDNAVGPRAFYGAFTVNMHNDTAASAGADAIVASAVARGVPVISARQLLDWVDGRNASSFSAIAFDAAARSLAFTIGVGAGARGLEALLPASYQNGLLATLTRDGTPVPFVVKTVKGISYAAFAAGAGAHRATYGAAPAAPVAPDTRIDSGPAALTNSRAAAVAFSATTPGSTFTCSLDAAAFAACSSPATYAALTSGSHTFRVAATASGLTDATPAATTWTVDAIGPAVSITAPAAAAIVSGTVAIAATATDNLALAGVQIRVDGVNLGAEDIVAPFSASWNTLTVTDGSHSLTAVARDTAGNTTVSAAIAVTVRNVRDTTAPIITGLTASATAAGTATVAWTTNELSDSRVSYGTSASMLSSSVADATRVTAHQLGLTGLAPNTTYYYRVASADAAGNSATAPPLTQAPAKLVTPPLRYQTLSPSSVVLVTGTRKSGSASSLQADDNVYYSVASTAAPGTTAWYGVISGVTNALRSLTIGYKGQNSATASQTVSIWRWTDSRWIALDTRSVGRTEINIDSLTQPGALADYVSGTSGTGTVRIRVKSTRSAGRFDAHGDRLQIVVGYP